MWHVALWRHTEGIAAYNVDLHVVLMWNASKWVYGNVMHVSKGRSQLHHRAPARVRWMCQAGVSCQKRVRRIWCVLHDHLPAPGCVAELQICRRFCVWERLFLCALLSTFFSAGRLRSCRWRKVARWGAARPDACVCCVCLCCGADRSEQPFQEATSKSI